MPYAQNLQSLTTREAITDAVWRTVIAFDRNDVALLKTACYEDIVFEIHGGEAMTGSWNGFSEIQNTVFKNVGPMDTTHMISNVRVDVKDGANTAALTCYAMATHCPPGRGKEPNGPKFTTGGEYWIDLTKDEKDGLWKIKKWVLDLIWTTGDASVMQPPS